jgi:iron complex outermembrane recepter protein
MVSSRRLGLLAATALIAPTFMIGGVAYAADAAASSDSGNRIAEVIVTARKREESVQKVPIAITAVQGELKTADIRDVEDIVAFTPNVRIDNNPLRGNAAVITIRGVSPTRTDDNSIDSPIGVVIDGIYLGSLPGQIVQNFDLDRIEVLRGPQGTLFGRNTVGGALNIVRTEPTGKFGASLQYTTGSWNDQEFRGVVNAPIIKDVLSAKIYFISENRDGYVHNTYLNTNQPQKDYKNYGITLKFTPGEKYKVLFTAERFLDKSEGGQSLFNYNYAPGVLPVPTNVNDINASGGFLTCLLYGPSACRTSTAMPTSISTNITNPGRVDTWAYTLNQSFKINDNLKFVSITGYRHQHEQTLYDFDGSSANFINIGTDAHYHQWSEEARFEGEFNTKYGRVDGVVGFYYFNSGFTRGWTTSGDFWNTVESFSGVNLATDTWNAATIQAITGHPGQTPYQITGFNDPVGACLAYRDPNAPVGTLMYNRALIFGQVACDPGYGNTTSNPASGQFPYGPGTVQKLFEQQDTHSTAFFAHADWHFAPKLTLAAGVRYTHETKDFIGYQSYLAPLSRVDVFQFPSNTGVLNLSGDQVTPSVQLSWQATEDVMAYASFSEGWHSGGFFGVNQNTSDFEKTYAPETSRSYEIGLKSRLFDNSLQVNLAGFINDFHNKQESAVALDPTTNTVVTVFTNVGGLRYEGFEAEVQWKPIRQLLLEGSLGYLHAYYTELNIAYPNAVNSNVPVQTNATFLTPRFAPKVTLGGSATYTIPVGPGTAAIGAKLSYVDSQQGDLYNASYGFIPAHTDISVSGSYSYKNYKITVFGRNLTGWQHETPFYIATLFASSTIGPPASWGLELAAKF